MANVDYVSVWAPTADAIDAVKAATNLSQLIEGVHLINGDNRSQVTITGPDSEGDNTDISVYYGGDIAEQSALARQIYDHIVEHTDWDAELSSDDEGIIAARIAQR